MSMSHHVSNSKAAPYTCTTVKRRRGASLEPGLEPSGVKQDRHLLLHKLQKCDIPREEKCTLDRLVEFPPAVTIKRVHKMNYFTRGALRNSYSYAAAPRVLTCTSRPRGKVGIVREEKLGFTSRFTSGNLAPPESGLLLAWQCPGVGRQLT